MVLTSIKNKKVIKDNAKKLGITFKESEKVIKIYSNGLNDETISNRLKYGYGIGSIVENFQKGIDFALRMWYN